jgi:hypothetical protein
MLYQFFDRLEEDKLSSMIDFIILKILSLLNNTDDNEIKELINHNLDKVFRRLNSERFEIYLNRILEWLSNDSEDRGMKRLALNLLAILSGNNFEAIEAKGQGIKKILLEIIEKELITFEKDLGNKLEREEYERLSKKNELNKLFKGSIEDEDNITVLNIKFDNWDLLYLSLNILEKMIKNYPDLWKGYNKDTLLFLKLVRAFRHPHNFIKSIALRLISHILNNMTNFTHFNNKLLNHYVDNISPIQFLLVNLRYMILNPTLSEKILDKAMSTIVYLLVNSIKINEDMVYESVCRLYVESKSYISNKEIAPIIFERIFNIIDQLFELLNESELRIFLEPLLSLAYRLVSNNSVSDELKNKANIVKFINI